MQVISKRKLEDNQIISNQFSWIVRQQRCCVVRLSVKRYFMRASHAATYSINLKGPKALPPLSHFQNCRKIIQNFPPPVLMLQRNIFCTYSESWKQFSRFKWLMSAGRVGLWVGEDWFLCKFHSWLSSSFTSDNSRSIEKFIDGWNQS